MMKNLFKELEEEREVSATAASAAMSMILKLQKEKDVERMEAWQYKRIAEEKMNHTDRALEILKEVMELKELEISYLRNQMQLNKLFADMDINRSAGAIQSTRSRLDGDMYNLSDNEWEQVLRDGKSLEPKKSLSTDMNSTEKHGEELNSPSIGTLQDSHPLDESSFFVASHQTDTCNDRVAQIGEDVEYTLQSDQLKDSCLGTEMDEIAVHPTSEVGTLQIPEISKTATDSSCIEREIMTEESELSRRVVTKERGTCTLSRFSATRKVGSMKNVDRHVRLSTGNYTPRAGVERTRSRLKRVQSKRMVELKDPRISKEQIIMLKEVYEQLGMIESHETFWFSGEPTK